MRLNATQFLLVFVMAGLLAACDSEPPPVAERLRPILMTTITTILGLMPLIVWQDPLFYSMAIVISSGLAIGTVLTLGVVPVMYSLFLRAPPPAKAEAAA